MTDPSSITPVTEEDDSNESDTTETSLEYKASNSVSSILYSSECNTDDKLTPSLVKISISRKGKAPKKRQMKSREHGQEDSDCLQNTSTSPFPYGCNPLHFKSEQKIIQMRKKQKRNSHGSSNFLTKYVLKKNNSHFSRQEEENFGVDDPDNCLYTDFSDTSSFYGNKSKRGGNQNVSFSEDDTNSGEDNNERPFFPDMRSDSWFQAKCFDKYWKHYNFVMEWYRQHLQAVNLLSSQMSQGASMFSPMMWAGNSTSSAQSKPKKKTKNNRGKRRARNRRLAKAKQRAEKEEDQNECDAKHDMTSESEEEELKMEITEDMMDFFATSFKHRIERDNNKKGEDAKPAVDEATGAKGNGLPVLGGPSEQPGVRRTAEMKKLYGFGSPMIQGMETALQMTYDNITDRHQPKLWPNMPLRIVFS